MYMNYIQQLHNKAQEDDTGSKDHFLKYGKGKEAKVYGPMTKAQGERIIRDNPLNKFKLMQFDNNALSIEEELRKIRLTKIMNGE